ncbi:MAG: hypothetical protein NC121_10965 [Blautia sp.]|nr:hypothetical protein [Blautia sp.]
MKPFAKEAELAEKLECLSALNVLLDMDEKGDNTMQELCGWPEPEITGKELIGLAWAVIEEIQYMGGAW